MLKENPWISVYNSYYFLFYVFLFKLKVDYIQSVMYGSSHKSIDTYDAHGEGGWNHQADKKNAVLHLLS